MEENIKILIDEEPKDKKSVLFKVNVKNKCLKRPQVLYLLALQTIYAIKNDELLAKRPEIDFLLRLAKTDQIYQAKDLCSGNDHTIYVLKEKAAYEFNESDLEEAELGALVVSEK